PRGRREHLHLRPPLRPRGAARGDRGDRAAADVGVHADVAGQSGRPDGQVAPARGPRHADPGALAARTAGRPALALEPGLARLPSPTVRSWSVRGTPGSALGLMVTRPQPP